MTNVDYLFIGVAMLIVGYSIPATRNATILFGAVIIVGLLLRFQGTIVKQVQGLVSQTKGG